MKLTKFLIILSISTVSVVADVNMSFTEIGKAGNAADDYVTSGRTNRGAVSYSYSIGTYEVSLSQFQQSGLSTGTTPWTDPNDPVTSITHAQAAQFCNYMSTGNTNNGVYTIGAGGSVTVNMTRDQIVNSGGVFYVLPTEDEWYKAAYFNMDQEKYFEYAVGNDSAGLGLAGVNVDGFNGGAPWDYDQQGGFEQNGTANMAGNVWELLEESDIIRGGSYDSSTAGIKASNVIGIPPPQFWDQIGFRVVAIPEPGTISLMSLSTLGIFLTRTTRRRRQLGKTLLPVRREHLCDTYCGSVEELVAMQPQLEQKETLLGRALVAGKEQVAQVWLVLMDCYKNVDRNFWNRMVVIHEHRVSKRKEFKVSFKKKVLNGFDAFLALIMK